MRSKCFKAFILALLLTDLGGNVANAGWIVRLFYGDSASNSISGTLVTDLTNAKGTNSSGVVYNIFPNGPNRDGSPLNAEIETTYFEGPQTSPNKDNFGSMLQGFVEAPQTGAYTFYIYSDDSSELWLSTDATPANKVKIASVTGSTGLRVLTTYASQTSTQINLVRGQKYYVQAIHKEGTGSDLVGVAWKLPDGTLQNPIPTLSVQPYPLSFYADPSILAQPLDVAVQENTPATFSVTVNASQPVSFQWTRGVDQSPIIAIPNANLGFYQIPSAQLSDNGSTFRVQVSASTGVLLSRVARLTVTNDITPPTITSATATLDLPTQVRLSFSEPVTTATATDPSKYQINNGVQVLAAIFDPSAASTNMSVILYTSQLITNTTYTLTVNGIKDFATIPNTISNNTSVNFSFGAPLLFSIIENVSGGAQSDATNNATWKAGGPYDREYFEANLETGTASLDRLNTYVGRLAAYLFPPTNGLYTFWIASDDASVLFLSTDDNPANKVPITGYNGASGFRTYNQTANLFWATLPAGSDGTGTIQNNIAFTNATAGASSTAFASGTIRPTTGTNNAFTLTARIINTGNGTTVILTNTVAVGAETATYASPNFTIAKNANSTVNQIIAAINSPIIKQRSNPISLVGGKRYYIEAVLKENSGSDYINVAWQKPGDPIVQNGGAAIPGSFLAPFGYNPGPIAINVGPTNQVVAEGQRVTITLPAGSIDGTPVAVEGNVANANPPYYYQWYKGGAPIPGASGVYTKIGNSGTLGPISGVADRSFNQLYSLMVPVVYAADNGVAYTVMVSNNFSVAFSSSAILTVTSTVPTAIVGALFTNTVSVAYNTPVDPVSATNPANYVLATSAGTNVPIAAISIVNDRSINLLTTNLVANSSYALTISNVKDQFLSATIVKKTFNFVAFNAPYTRINNTQTYTINPTNNTLEAGGADIWNTADNCGFAAQQVTGNFDYIMRVDSIDQPNNSAKIGIMARETLDPGTGTSRNIYVMASPAVEIGGRDLYYLQYRNSTGGSSSTAGSTPNVKYPYTYLRLQRVGAQFYAWYSYDGINWTQFGSADTSTWSAGTLPSTLYLGVALASHTTSATAHAQVSGFGALTPIPVDFTFSTPPASVTSLQSRTVTFTFSGSGTNGPFSYQWQKNGVDIPGATGTSYTTPRLGTNDNGAVYQVIVKNSTSIKASPAATVTVITDTVPPNLVSAAAFFGGRNVILRYDEDLDPNSVTATSNYSIQSYRGSITSATYLAADQAVVLALNLPVSTNFTVVANNVKDLAGNVSKASTTLIMVRMTDKDIGTIDLNTGLLSDPIQPGVGYPLSITDFSVIAGGSDIWNNADGFHFVYQAVTNDFDVKVRVQSLQYVSDNWAKAGLMVREDTTGGGRDLNLVVDPSNGANIWEPNYRNLTNGASAVLPGAATVGPVSYPNAWCRIIRQGPTFYELRSIDGVNWDLRATFTPTNPYPAAVLVGMCTTAHNNTAGTNTVAEYRDFSLSTLTAPKLLSAVGSPDLSTVTLSFDNQMDNVTASQIANYTITSGLTISKAILSASGQQIVLTTSAQTPGTFYTVTINKVLTQSGVPIGANSRASFTAWFVTSGFVYHEVWNNLPKPLSNLKSSPLYPQAANFTENLIRFEAPTTPSSNYSQKISGFVVPSVTANYTFFISASDPAELYLSPTNNSAGKILIATVNNGTGVREWNKEPNQKSGFATLQAGQSYYIEALHATGPASGGSLAVTWTADGSTPANGTPPIGWANLASYTNPDQLPYLQITTQPKSISVIKTQPASFNVVATAFQPIFYQWQVMAVGSTNWVDVDGALGPSLTFAHADPSLTGTQYRVIVSIPTLQLTSSVVTLTVINDTTPPVLLAATSVVGSTNITLKFSKALDPTTASNRLNYVLFGGYSIVSATLLADGVTVILTIDIPLVQSENIWPYKVVDLAGNQYPNQNLTPVILVGQAGLTPATSQTAIRSALAITRSGNDVVLSWPASFGNVLTLQSSSDTRNWTPVNLPVQVQGDQNTVTVPIGNSTQLYRLSK